MAEAILMKGGNTVYSEDCTAVATDILKPYTGHTNTAIYNGSGDEPKAGEMENRAGTTQSTGSNWIADSKVQGNGLATGYYNGNTVVTIPIGPAIFGKAVPSQVLSGTNFLYANTNGTRQVTAGSMPNYTGKSKTGGAIDLNSENIRIQVASTGYYHTDSYVQAPASNFGNVASAYVLSNMTFTSTAGACATGGMNNRSGTKSSPKTSTATTEIISGYLYYKPNTNGYYNGYSRLNASVPVYAGGYSVS